MDIKIQLKKLIQTAELYRSQGLLFEATGKYDDALTLLQGSELMEGNQKLADIISKKISAVKNDIKKIEKQPILPEVSREQQDIIKNLFTESKDTSKESDVLEGALTLAKFGQFERSLEELNELLKAPHLRMKAAKNILRCHMARASIEDAYSQFQKWQSSNLFSPNQLITIRLFLEVFRFDNLKENVSLQLRDPEHVDELEITDGEFPDICSMIITFDDGPLKGGTFVLDVSFQTGNVITLFVAGHKEELLDNFKVGKILKNLQFNTTIAIFKGKGIVDENMEDRNREAIKGERIVDEAVISFRHWFESLDVIPTIVELRNKMEDIAKGEIKKTLQTLKHLSNDDHEAIGRMTNAMIKKILHDPTLLLKSNGHHQNKSVYLDATRKLFKLDE